MEIVSPVAGSTAQTLAPTVLVSARAAPPVVMVTAIALAPTITAVHLVREAIVRHKFLILDPTTPGLIETWQELKYTRERFGLGNFSLVVPLDHAQSACLAKGKSVLIVRDTGATQEARFWGKITAVRKKYQAEAGPDLGGAGKGQVFVEVQGGSFTEYFLSGRIFTPPAPGSIPATDHLDDAFKAWVKYNLQSSFASADRAVTGFAVEADEHAGPSGSYEITYNLLLERIMALAKRYGVGVEIVGSWGSGATKLNAAASYTFQTCVPEGVDRTHDQVIVPAVVISRERGLVRTLEYEQDSSTERNVIIALGNQSAVEGGTRDQQAVTISPTPTGEARREGVLVAGDGATAADLTDVATKFLADEGIALESVRFEYAHPAPYTPITDFVPGDHVSFYDLLLGIGPWQPVVEEISCRIGGDGLEKYEVTLGRVIRPAEAEDAARRACGKQETLTTLQNDSAGASGPSIPGGNVVGEIPAGSSPAHVLATTAGLGEKHTVSGLTENQVLLATGATTAKFGLLPAAGLPVHAHAHGDLTGVTADQHHAQSHTLASHSTKAHSELTGVTADQHHAQSHSLASHTGTLAHGDLTGVTADQHHAESHSLASHTGSLAHGDLTGVSADQHHAQAHGHAHGDLTGVTADQHHAAVHHHAVALDTDYPTYDNEPGTHHRHTIPTLTDYFNGPAICIALSYGITGDASAGTPHTHGYGTLGWSDNLYHRHGIDGGSGYTGYDGGHFHGVSGNTGNPAY